MKGDKERIVRSVSFSCNDLYEMKLLKHAKNNGKFSKYIKRLIERDMNTINMPINTHLSSPNQQEIVFPEQKEKPVQSKTNTSKGNMSSFI